MFSVNDYRYFSKMVASSKSLAAKSRNAHLHFLVYLVVLENLFINNIFAAIRVELRWLSGSGSRVACVSRGFDSQPCPLIFY